MDQGRCTNEVREGLYMFPAHAECRPARVCRLPLLLALSLDTPLPTHRGSKILTQGPALRVQVRCADLSCEELCFMSDMSSMPAAQHSNNTTAPSTGATDLPTPTSIASVLSSTSSSSLSADLDPEPSSAINLGPLGASVSVPYKHTYRRCKPGQESTPPAAPCEYGAVPLVPATGAAEDPEGAMPRLRDRV